jgi:hypothetical protein
VATDLRAGPVAAKLVPRAVEAKYLPASRRLRVHLANEATLRLSLGVIRELRGTTRAQLSDIEILPGGDGLHCAVLEFTVRSPGLVATLLSLAARCNVVLLSQQSFRP